MMGPVVGQDSAEGKDGEVEPVGGELPGTMPESATVAEQPEVSPGPRVVSSELWESC